LNPVFQTEFRLFWNTATIKVVIQKPWHARQKSDTSLTFSAVTISHEGATSPFAVFTENMDSTIYSEIIRSVIFPFSIGKFDNEMKLHQDMTQNIVQNFVKKQWKNIISTGFELQQSPRLKSH
jgi:hypothetical protein